MANSVKLARHRTAAIRKNNNEKENILRTTSIARHPMFPHSNLIALKNPFHLHLQKSNISFTFLNFSPSYLRETRSYAEIAATTKNHAAGQVYGETLGKTDTTGNLLLYRLSFTPFLPLTDVRNPEPEIPPLHGADATAV